MVHPYYTEKILPFLEKNPAVNLLVKTPFLGTGFELKELAKNLRPDEELRYISACKSGEARVLVCVTNLRLHILDKGLILNKYQITVNLPKIASVQRGRGIFFGSVVISVMGSEDTIYLTDFWGKDTENFQRILQDAITDYGLGRSQLTQPNYSAPRPYTSQSSQNGSMSNNPLYNYLTGELFTEEELREQGLDRYGNPIYRSVVESDVVEPREEVPYRDTSNSRHYSRSERMQSVDRPRREVSNMSLSDRFDALDSGGFGTAEQLRDAKANLEEARRSGLISEELYRIKKRKYDRGLL